MSGDIDVAVVQEKGASLSRPRVRLTSYLRAERASIVKMVLVIAAVTGINLLALPIIGYRSASILYLMTVIALAFFTDRVAVLIAAGLSAILWDYFFLPPRFTFLITKLEDVLMFFLYFLTAAALAFLMSRLRLNQRMLAVRARRMGLLLDLSQSLSRQTSLAGIVSEGLEYVSRYLDVEVIAFLPEMGGGLQRVPHSLNGIRVDEKEREWPDGASTAVRPVGNTRTHCTWPFSTMSRFSPHRRCRRAGSAAPGRGLLASRPGGFTPDAGPHDFPVHRAGAAG